MFYDKNRPAAAGSRVEGNRKARQMVLIDGPNQIFGSELLHATWHGRCKQLSHFAWDCHFALLWGFVRSA